MPASGTTCDAFVDFFTDLTANTPHAPDLLAKAQAVQAAAIRTGQQVDEASDLVADVARSDFSENGNVYDPAINTLYDLCYPG
jgi:hypothetical protein